MHDTIAWSHDLLTEPERLLLRRLGVFSGGCTLAAAESVCAGTDLQSTHVAGLLASLVDKSLVNAVIDGERMRFVLLDSTRAFARERLAAADEQVAFARRHAQWLAASGEQVGREYLAQPNLVWLNEFASEIDNVRSALEWVLRSEIDDDALLAAQIAGSFRGLWLIQGWYVECRRWITSVLERIDETQQPLLVVNLLWALTQTLVGSDLLAAYNRLITVLRHVDDRLRLAQALANNAGRHCESGLLAEAQDAIDEARQILVEEGKLEPPSPRLGKIASTLLYSSIELSLARREFDEARTFIEEAMTLNEALGDEYILTSVATIRAEVEFVAGDTPLAAKYSEEAVKLADAIPRAPALVARALCVDAAIRLTTPDIRGGEAAARRAFSVSSTFGENDLQLILLQNLAATAIHRGCPQTGARLMGSTEVWRRTAGYQRSPFEEATYKILVTSLQAELGADTETLIAEGRRLNLEVAIEEVLSTGFF